MLITITDYEGLFELRRGDSGELVLAHFEAFEGDDRPILSITRSGITLHKIEKINNGTSFPVATDRNGRVKILKE